MCILKQTIASQVPNLRNRVRDLGKEHGKKSVSDVSIEQVLGGMRGVKSLICDTSEVALDRGLIIRGTPVAELTDKLPEEILFLLLTSKLPKENELADLKQELRNRSEVPGYIWTFLKNAPKEAHPMALFSAAITLLETESNFRKEYDK